MYRDGKLTTIIVIKTLVKTIFRLLVLNGVVGPTTAQSGYPTFQLFLSHQHSHQQLQHDLQLYHCTI